MHETIFIKLSSKGLTRTYGSSILGIFSLWASGVGSRVEIFSLYSFEVFDFRRLYNVEFLVLPSYAHMTLKIPGPKSVIIMQDSLQNVVECDRQSDNHPILRYSHGGQRRLSGLRVGRTDYSKSNRYRGASCSSVII
jgi:hypothetical protein